MAVHAAAFEFEKVAELQSELVTVGWLVAGSDVEQPLELDASEAVYGAEAAGAGAGAGVGAELGVGVELGVGAECKPEAVAALAHLMDEPAQVAAGTAELPVDMGNTADTAVDKGHIQDTAGNIVDIAVAVDTTALELAQQPELQLDLGELS